MSTTNQFFKLEPYCIINNRLCYNFNDSLLIFYEPFNKVWALTSFNNPLDVYATLDNDEFFLPIENVNGINQFDWNVIKTPPNKVFTLSGDCTLIQTYEDLCLSFTTKNGCSQQVYTYDGQLNGKPSWISSNNNKIFYNTSETPNVWRIMGNNLTGYFFSDTTSEIPDNGWQILGDPFISTIFVTQGACVPIFDFTTKITNAGCIDGGLIEVEPICLDINETYEFSINGGSSWQLNPIFSNLAAGTYSVCMKSTSNPQVCKSYAITQQGNPQNYTVEVVTKNPTYVKVGNPTTTFTKETQFDIEIKDINNLSLIQLPAGLTITFDLKITDTFISYDSNPPIPANVYNFEVDGNPLTPIIQSIASTTQPNNGSGCNGLFITTSSQIRTYSNVTISDSFMMNGFVKNIQTSIQPRNPACAKGGTLENTTQIEIVNVKVNNNSCYNVTPVNPQPIIGCDGFCQSSLPILSSPGGGSFIGTSQWTIKNLNCGFGQINSVSINNVSITPSTGSLPIFPGNQISRNDPSGVNYGGANTIQLNTTVNIAGPGNCAYMRVYVNGGLQQTLPFTSAFPTINGIIINSGDIVVVEVDCQSGPCPP